MAAGPMRHRATFEREAAGTDDFGNVTQGAWSTLTECWATFQPERSRERIEAGRLESAVTGTLKIRSTAATRAITEADRVVFRSETYQIRAITNPDQRGRFLEMTVERGVAV